MERWNHTKNRGPGGEVELYSQDTKDREASGEVELYQQRQTGGEVELF